MTITKQLQQAIGNSGLPRSQIARLSGVSNAALSRFVSGERSIGLGSVDKLARVLGLRLVSEPNRKRR